MAKVNWDWIPCCWALSESMATDGHRHSSAGTAGPVILQPSRCCRNWRRTSPAGWTAPSLWKWPCWWVYSDGPFPPGFSTAGHRSDCRHRPGWDLIASQEMTCGLRTNPWRQINESRRLYSWWNNIHLKKKKFECNRRKVTIGNDITFKDMKILRVTSTAKGSNVKCIRHGCRSRRIN